MKNLRFGIVLVITPQLTACMNARVIALSEPRSTYVIRSSIFGTNMLHCQAGEGPDPNPVCTEVQEVR